MPNKYYQKQEKRLQKEAGEKYQNLPEEAKGQQAKKGLKKISKFYWRRKSQYHHECNKTYTEKQKRKLVAYIKNYYLTHEK